MSRVRFALMIGSLVTAIGVSACAKKPPAPAPAPPPPPPPATKPAPPPPPPPPPPAPVQPPRALTEDEVFAKKTVEELNAERPLGDVYFAFDSQELSDEARATLERNAQWLKRWPSVRLSVEGHCDSRGTAEYNLSLGERRGTAARNYLVGLGVPADRVVAVSKGKEQPFCFDENESCWSQNRRGHFMITAK